MLTACDADDTADASRCVPGASTACTHVSGCSGAQLCAPDGRSVGPCVCSAGSAENPGETDATGDDGGTTTAGTMGTEGASGSGEVPGTTEAPGGSDAGPTPAEPDPDPVTDAQVTLPEPATGPTCRGHATRYWYCCKTHCGWVGNVPDGVTPVVSCAEDDSPHDDDFNVASSCSALEANSAYTCFSMVPRAIDDTLSYGYAAVPDDGTGDVCGRC